MAAAATTYDSDDEVQIVCCKGNFANVDYVHHRSCCAVKPWGVTPTGDRVFCVKCHCSVCEVPASECSAWDDHCRVSASDPTLPAKRDAWQRDSLSQGSVALDDPHLLDKLVQHLSDERDVPVRPQAGVHSFVGTRLSSSQKQALSWMCKLEEAVEAGRRVDLYMDRQACLKGGILADEMGVGKTHAIAALCVARPLRLTLIVVPPHALLKQWETVIRECTTLRVALLYGVRQDEIAASIREYDVIIAGANSKLHQAIAARVDRLVVDEAHLLLSSCSGQDGPAISFARQFGAAAGPIRWAVTGTPFQGKSLLTRQNTRILQFAVGTEGGSKAKVCRPLARVQAGTLKSFILRRRLPGSNTTPKLKTETLRVDLSAEEEELRKLARCLDHRRHPLSGRSEFRVEEMARIFEMERLVLTGQLSLFMGEARERILGDAVPPGYAHEWIVAQKTRLVRLQMLCTQGTAGPPRTAEGGAGETLSRAGCSERDLPLGSLAAWHPVGRVVPSPRSVLDGIVTDLRRRRSADAAIYALVVADAVEETTEYLSRHASELVFVPASHKVGSNTKKAQAAVHRFQQGDGDVLVLPARLAEQGVNLQRAGAIYLTDPVLSVSRRDQIFARIVRPGSAFAEVSAVTVVPRNTVQEAFAACQAEPSTARVAFGEYIAPRLSSAATHTYSGVPTRVPFFCEAMSFSTNTHPFPPELWVKAVSEAAGTEADCDFEYTLVIARPWDQSLFDDSLLRVFVHEPDISDAMLLEGGTDTRGSYADQHKTGLGLRVIDFSGPCAVHRTLSKLVFVCKQKRPQPPKGARDQRGPEDGQISIPVRACEAIDRRTGKAAPLSYQAAYGKADVELCDVCAQPRLRGRPECSFFVGWKPRENLRIGVNNDRGVHVLFPAIKGATELVVGCSHREPAAAFRSSVPSLPSRKRLRDEKEVYEAIKYRKFLVEVPPGCRKLDTVRYTLLGKEFTDVVTEFETYGCTTYFPVHKPASDFAEPACGTPSSLPRASGACLEKRV